MPRTADHDGRRAQIADGLVRVAAREGLHAVTMRSVAAEAGVSVRLVQYYFQTKAELVRSVLGRLARQSNERWAARLAELPQPVSARAYVEAFLAEALPTDADSRAFHLVGTSYAVLAMTDAELAEQPLPGLGELEHGLADALRRGRAEGDLAADRDPDAEAARLVALNHGLGTTVLLGRRTAEEAQTVLRYHLDLLFPDQPTDQPGD